MSEKYALFLGCVIPVQTPFIEKLGRDLLPELGIELVDVDFTCCPYGAVRDIDETKWLVGAARNLAVAEKQGIDIVSLCNGCAQTLIEAHHALKNRDKRAEVNKYLAKQDLEYKGTVKIFHVMMLLEEKMPIIKEKMTRSLRGLRFATHTGCHILRPAKVINYDSPEDPVKFDQFVRDLGGKAIDYQTKTLCCGSTVITNEKDMSLDMMKDKFEELSKLKVNGLMVCCPSCFLQYDRNQILVKAKYKIDYNISVVHALQLLAYVLGKKEYFIKENRSAKELKCKMQ